jgi:hypothetical protein
MLFLLCGSIAAACATGSSRHDHAVFSGHTLEEVRLAARGVVEEVAYPPSVVRLTAAGVLTEGRIGVCGEHVTCGEDFNWRIGTPWTTIKIQFRNLGIDTAAKIDIVYQTRDHCEGRRLDVGCAPEYLSSTGGLERQIITGIRARLAGKSENHGILGQQPRR